MKFNLFGNNKKGNNATWEQVASVSSALLCGFNTPEAFALIAGWTRRECGND